MASTASKAVSTAAKAAAAKSSTAVGSNVAKAAVIGVNIGAASNATASKTSTNKSTTGIAVKNSGNSNPKNLSKNNNNKSTKITLPSFVEKTIDTMSKVVSEMSKKAGIPENKKPKSTQCTNSSSSKLIPDSVKNLINQTYNFIESVKASQKDKNNNSNKNINRADTYYCQTGGWFENTDGSTACMATSYATLVSLTTGKSIKPNEVENEGNDGYLDDAILTWTGNDGNTYSVKGNSTTQTTNDIWGEISDSLNSGEKGIVIHLGTHWVTVTGVKEGVDINNISGLDDLIGIDPWYNGGNGINNHEGTGYNSSSSTYSGEIDLGLISSKYSTPSGRYIRLVQDN